MKKNGFTLIEVLIAIILVGVAIASLVAANITFTRANIVGTNLSTAEFLVEQIRERTAPVSYTDLRLVLFGNSNLDTAPPFSPPINANGDHLEALAGFSQQVTVENVNASNFEQVDVSHTSSFIRVTVKVLWNGDEITSVSWIRAKY